MPDPGGPLLLAVPSAVEGRAILRRCPPGAEILRCGVGPSAAGRLAARLARGSAAGVLAVGTAGGLDPDLAPGALLLPAELRLAGGERLRLP
ncbi:MAG: 4-hydroxy-3-methylbut-2-enyl diphosphate reductase, partial [Gammaproteobacteria bacterium]